MPNFEREEARITSMWNRAEGQQKQQTKQTTQEARDNPEDIPRKWPQLPKEALSGIAGEVVELATRDSEADPAAVLITLLTWFGASVGNEARIMVGEQPHCARLYVAIVGASSRARKGTSKGPVRRIMQAAENKALEKAKTLAESSRDKIKAKDNPCPTTDGPLSSGEGLINVVRDGKPTKDEDGEIVKDDLGAPMLKDGVEDKRLLVIEGEFGATLKVMQREGNTLSTTLRCAWDMASECDKLSPITKNSSIQATNPHICIVGHITKSELMILLTTSDLHNGLVNRVLWACVRRTRPVPLPQPLDSEAVSNLAGCLASRIEAARRRTTMTLDSDTAQAWIDVYEKLTEDRPGAWGAATSRAEAQVTRLALLYALLDGDHRIRIHHLHAALALWRYCDQSACYLFGDTVTDPETNKVLLALIQGPKTQTELSDTFSRHIPQVRLKAILEQLQESGRVSMETIKGKGRPTTEWRLREGFKPPGEGLEEE